MDIAEAFNNYFSSIGNNLAASIPIPDHLYLKATDKTFSLQSPTFETVYKLITLLKLSPLFIINYIIHSIHNRIFSRSFNLFISATFRTVLLSVFSAALQLVMLTHAN